VDSFELLPPPTFAFSESENPSARPVREVRLLSEAEIATLAPVFEESGAVLPDPVSSFIVGSVDATGHVCGFLVIQAAIHAEPMYLEPGASDQFLGLVHRAEKEIATRLGGGNVFLFAPVGKISSLASSCGMNKEPWVVYSKNVAPPAPVIIEPVPYDFDPDPDFAPEPDFAPGMEN
jgi:hypothetical protein